MDERINLGRLEPLRCMHDERNVGDAIVERRIPFFGELVFPGKIAMVEGVPQLSGATVMATDLRASASLVIAGLVVYAMRDTIFPKGDEGGQQGVISKDDIAQELPLRSCSPHPLRGRSGFRCARTTRN